MSTIRDAFVLPKPTGPDNKYGENQGYAYQWWLVDGGIFMAMGIYGFWDQIYNQVKWIE